MNEMLEMALRYHGESLCVIPVVSKNKMPAIVWEEYQERRSTSVEIMEWFGNGKQHNVGIVHGEVSGNYISLDIDHDAGLWVELQAVHPSLFEGRLERSGSGAGYHIPLIVEQLPDLGHNTKDDRPRGNKTWKTGNGHLNVRARFCQSVAPPSVHPSGGRYVFIQDGPITRLPSLDDLIVWLNKLAPPPAPRRAPGPKQYRDHDASGTLVEAVKSAWGTLDVFAHFNLATEAVTERNGETRLRGNGGLLIAGDATTWYNFSDEFGGGVVEAWGWCRFGSAYDNKRHFRQVLLEMAQAAGIDTARYHKRGDERVTTGGDGDRRLWSKEHGQRWGRMRG